MTLRNRIQAGDGDPRHGTANGYTNHGCRCPLCKASGTESQRAVKAGAEARGLAPDDPRHGTVCGYTYWGCRLPCCQTARRAYDLGARDRKNAARRARRMSARAARETVG